MLREYIDSIMSFMFMTLPRKVLPADDCSSQVSKSITRCAPVAPRTIRCDKSWLSDFQWLVTAFKSPGKKLWMLCQKFCFETIVGSHGGEVQCIFCFRRLWDLMNDHDRSWMVYRRTLDVACLLCVICNEFMCHFKWNFVCFFQQQFSKHGFHEWERIHRRELTMAMIAFLATSWWHINHVLGS